MAASISVFVGKYEYLFSLFYLKEVNAYLNYQQCAVVKCLDRCTFNGMYALLYLHQKIQPNCYLPFLLTSYLCCLGVLVS